MVGSLYPSASGSRSKCRGAPFFLPRFPAFSQKEQNGPSFFTFSWRFQKVFNSTARSALGHAPSRPGSLAVARSGRGRWAKLWPHPFPLSCGGLKLCFAAPCTPTSEQRRKSFPNEGQSTWALRLVFRSSSDQRAVARAVVRKRHPRCSLAADSPQNAPLLSFWVSVLVRAMVRATPPVRIFRVSAAVCTRPSVLLCSCPSGATGPPTSSPTENAPLRETKRPEAWSRGPT